MLISNQNNNSLGDNSILSGRDTNITNILQHNTVSLLENIPDVDLNYIERKSNEKNFLEKLEKCNMLQVHGISGIGKTELVKKVVNRIKNEYSRCYWISCNNHEEIDLENIVTLRGVKINLIENLKREKIIVVVDNYNKPIDAIASKFEMFNFKNSKLIFSSQEKTSSHKVEKVFVEYMTFYEAYNIFEITGSDQFKTDEFRNFLLETDRHPMMLQILKNYILDDDNGINFSDFKNSLQLVLLEDNEISQSQKICEKIVGDYYKRTKFIYQFLSLVNNNIIEEDFLKCIAVSDVSGLVKKSFLRYNKDHYYMHSIILDSIRVVVNNDNTKNSIIPYENEIIKYLETQIDLRNIKYYRFIAYNNNFLENLYKITDNQYLKILLYNSFITFSNYHNSNSHIKNIELLLDKNEFKRYYEIKLLIELIELKANILGKEDKDKKEIFIKSRIKKLEELKENVKSDIECMQLINHHIAKLYNWIGRYDEAINIIKEIIQNNPKEYTSILQLCRAYRQKIYYEKCNNEQVEKYLDSTFSILSNLDYKNMPISIYLELVTLIINRPLNESRILKVCLWDNFNHFTEAALLYSKNNIFEHTYLTIGHLASTLSYNKKEFYKEWFKKIEHPNFNECSKELLMAIINIYCSEVKRRKYNNESYSELVKAISVFWNTYKEKHMVNLKNNSVDFIYKPIIEFYIAIEKYELADTELSEIYNSLNEWHLKFKTSILKGLGEFNEAKGKIEEAIKIYSNKGEIKYKASFYNDYAEILYEMKDEKCFKKLEYAIQICDNKNTKKSWENKLQKWKKGYK